MQAFVFNFGKKYDGRKFPYFDFNISFSYQKDNLALLLDFKFGAVGNLNNVSI